MGERFIRFSKFVAPVLLVLGLACSFLEWGEPDKLHGQGFPIPTVIWDRAQLYNDDPTIPDGRFVDFVNPLGLILNPLLFLLVGLVIFFALELGRKILRIVTKSRPA